MTALNSRDLNFDFEKINSKKQTLDQCKASNSFFFEDPKGQTSLIVSQAQQSTIKEPAV